MQIESVIVLNDFCHAQGGASRVAIDEAIALRASGLRVQFLGATGPIDQDLVDSGVSVICLDQPELADARHRVRAASGAMWNLAAWRTMRAVLAPLDPRRTIVHLHGYTKALSTSPAVAARRAGFATICTLHDFFTACPNGAFYNYRRHEPCTLRALSPECLVTACDKRSTVHKAYRVVRGVIQRSVARFPACVSHYIALSRRSAAVLRPYLPADAQLYPLANIIDVRHAPPVDPGANAPLMVVGRLDEEKGVVLAALTAAFAGFPIVFVGDGPRRAAIEATGAHVTGWLSAADVQRELAKARCLVFPSLWYETFGLVVSEAAALGVPAIVSDISAPADRVIDGETGWVFRSGDFADLRRRLEITRDDAAVRAAGAAAYRAYWASPADPGRHTSDLLAIYADVVSSASGTAYADNPVNARASASEFSQRQSTNLTPSANARALAMAAADPNHPTAPQCVINGRSSM
jgi:glycosyltransferase involved in cell wall biosynthesis